MNHATGYDTHHPVRVFISHQGGASRWPHHGSVQRVKAKVSKRTAQAKRTAAKKSQAMAEKGRKAVRSSAKQVRKLAKATGNAATSGQKTARAKARKAGAAIGTILGRAQGLSRKLVNKARRTLT
ncbi:MAG: hypothetical protein HC801_00955 [Nitrospira sp.]|nr:hypothetical protein [Nitrospira sp.]